jgi:hypothetical protein
VNIFVGNTEDSESEYGPSNDNNGTVLFLHLIREYGVIPPSYSGLI